MAMRHVYFALVKQYLLPRLLLSRPDSLRSSFQLLSSRNVLSSFALQGFVRHFPADLQRPKPDFDDPSLELDEWARDLARMLWKGHFATAQADKTRTQAPFVPELGPIVLSRKNLPRHVDFDWD